MEKEKYFLTIINFSHNAFNLFVTKNKEKIALNLLHMNLSLLLSISCERKKQTT